MFFYICLFLVRHSFSIMVVLCTDDCVSSLYCVYYCFCVLLPYGVLSTQLRLEAEARHEMEKYADQMLSDK